jgi:hypothetical protein
MKYNKRIVVKFEEYASSPEFTENIVQFIQENCNKLVEAKENGEHSME